MTTGKPYRLLVGVLAWGHRKLGGNHDRQAAHAVIPTNAAVTLRGTLNEGRTAVVEFRSLAWRVPAEYLAPAQSEGNVPDALDRPRRTA